MIFEDAHWLDPTSHEAARSDHGPDKNAWGAADCNLPAGVRAAVDRAAICNRAHSIALGEREIAAMIDRVTGNKLLPESIRQDIIERTDGIPLFVEEMTKAVLEAEAKARPEHTAAAVPSPALACPQAYTPH